MKRSTILILMAVVLMTTYTTAQSTLELKVDVNKPIAEIQPTMWGIFFEDINFAADGGLYAEMIKNRSFEFDHPLMGWQQPNSNKFSLNKNSGIANVVKESEGTNRHFLRVELFNAANYVIINEGFRGMGVKQGQQYNLTFNAKINSGTISTVKFQLIDKDGQPVGETTVPVKGNEWKEYEGTLVASVTEGKAKLQITFDGNGVIDLDMISLFPEDTWMGRPKGLRKDLVQLLADLNPGFLRFPGGCIVEGRTLDQRYQWKKTVGDIEDREMIINRWNTEFSHRLTPDYFQTFGLGFFEYFQLAEDIGATPLPILSCGMACQFNTGELVPMDELDPYVQDALDLIEFANGATDSKWGKIRAEMGHPEPFNLKYIGVGNEQWGTDYFDRLKVFVKEIKEKYPEVIIVSGTGPFSDGEQFEYAEKELKKLNAEIVDEHYYKSPEWFLENADRYDDYARDSYKIFAGEYAAQSVETASPKNKNNWKCAMSEAAYMTGLERNADVVWLTSYAPLFAHVDGWQWTPDLIWFDNLRSFGTPNYQVQKLFANNAGTKAIPISEGKNPVINKDGIFASSVLDENTQEIIVKLVNTGESAKPININLSGSGKLAGEAQLITLESEDLEAVNTLDNPESISPKTSVVQVVGKKIKLDAPAYSLSIIRVKQQ